MSKQRKIKEKTLTKTDILIIINNKSIKDKFMFTAEQIAEETGIELYTVRYRLSELRRKGKIKAKQFGTTYVYPPTSLDKVKKFTGRQQ